MEQFSLEKYLKNPTRKVCTRDGREVEILKTNCKGKIPMLVLYDSNDVRWVAANGTIKDNQDTCSDLFFADEEEELTEFETLLLSWMSDDTSGEIPMSSMKECVKHRAKTLLDLARREICKDNVIVTLSEWDLLKQKWEDLPKWKKATEYKDFEINEACILDDDIYPIIATNVNIGEYYLELDELKNLPLEK